MKVGFLLFVLMLVAMGAHLTAARARAPLQVHREDSALDHLDRAHEIHLAVRDGEGAAATSVVDGEGEGGGVHATASVLQSQKLEKPCSQQASRDQ